MDPGDDDFRTGRAPAPKPVAHDGVEPVALLICAALRQRPLGLRALDCMSDELALGRIAGMTDRVHMLLVPVHHALFGGGPAGITQEAMARNAVGFSVAQHALLACGGGDSGVDWFAAVTAAVHGVEAELSFVCCVLYHVPVANAAPPLSALVVAVLRPRAQPYGCVLDEETPGLALLFGYRAAGFRGAAATGPPEVIVRRFLDRANVLAAALAQARASASAKRNAVTVVPSAAERRRAQDVASSWRPPAGTHAHYLGAAWVDADAHVVPDARATASWFTGDAPTAPDSAATEGRE